MTPPIRYMLSMERNSDAPGWIVRKVFSDGFEWTHYTRWRWQASREYNRMSRSGPHIGQW